MTEKLYRFFVSSEQKEFQDWLDSFPNFSKTVKQYLTDIRSRKLDYKNEDNNLTTEYKRLRNQKLSLEIQIKEREITYYKTFGKPPTVKVQSVMKIGVTNSIQTISCYDDKNNRFQCPECGVLFVFDALRKEIAQSKEQFVDHYYKKHGEVPAQIIQELTDLN